MAKLTMEQFSEKLDRWWRMMPHEAWKAVSQAAVLISNEVQASHLTGPRMPRGVGDPKNATLAVQTGRLRRSIWHSVTKPGQSARITARIGTNVKYARIHEYGGTIQNAFGRKIKVTMPERAFLRPSLEKKRPRALELIQQAMLRAYEGGHVGGV